jgi:tripartite-type tricarboxylate transporter receptor subunit TctC
MNTELNKLLQDPEVAQRMLTIGPIAEVMGPAPWLEAYLKQENDRWNEVSKEIGLLPE